MPGQPQSAADRLIRLEEGYQMLIEPTIDELLEKVDSKYSLVVAAAKRARELVDGADPLEKAASNKPVSIAVKEIGPDKIVYEQTKDGIK